MKTQLKILKVIGTTIFAVVTGGFIYQAIASSGEPVLARIGVGLLATAMGGFGIFAIWRWHES